MRAGADNSRTPRLKSSRKYVARASPFRLRPALLRRVLRAPGIRCSRKRGRLDTPPRDAPGRPAPRCPLVAYAAPGPTLRRARPSSTRPSEPPSPSFASRTPRHAIAEQGGSLRESTEPRPDRSRAEVLHTVGVYVFTSIFVDSTVCDFWSFQVCVAGPEPRFGPEAKPSGPLGRKSRGKSDRRELLPLARGRECRAVGRFAGRGGVW